MLKIKGWFGIPSNKIDEFIPKFEKLLREYAGNKWHYDFDEEQEFD